MSLVLDVKQNKTDLTLSESYHTFLLKVPPYLESNKLTPLTGPNLLLFVGLISEFTGNQFTKNTFVPFISLSGLSVGVSQV